jgi:hypothetical protein
MNMTIWALCDQPAGILKGMQKKKANQAGSKAHLWLCRERFCSLRAMPLGRR